MISHLPADVLGQLLLFFEFGEVYTVLCCLCRQFGSITNPASSSANHLPIFFCSKIQSLKLLQFAITKFNLCYVEQFIFCSKRMEISKALRLPTHLKVLNISRNFLSYIPNVLPSNLEHFQCSQNHLNSLPMLPKALKRLICDNNHLSHLPSIGPCLEILNCANNYINCIPALPVSLQKLSCYSNELKELPDLSSLVKLKELECGNNSLTFFSELPSSLEVLSCEHNKLTFLPSFPKSLKLLDIRYNLLVQAPLVLSPLLSVQDNCNPFCS